MSRSSYIPSTNLDNNDGYKFISGIGPITDNILNDIFNKITSNNFGERILAKVSKPLMTAINQKIQPYIYWSIAMYLLIIVLLIVIIYLLVKRNRS